MVTIKYFSARENYKFEQSAGISSPQFTLKTPNGNYAMFSTDANISSYNGLFHRYNKGNSYSIYKTIEDLKLIDDKDYFVENNVSEIEISENSITRNHNSHAKEIFELFDDGLFFQVSNFSGKINLKLDFRDIYSDPKFGRHYEILKHKNVILIAYTLSDETTHEIYEKKYMAIIGIEKFEKNNLWKTAKYEFDKRRATNDERFIFDAININVNSKIKLFFGFGDKADVAINTARKLKRENIQNRFFEKQKVKRLLSSFNLENIPDKDIKISTKLSIKSLNKSYNKYNGLPIIQAGYPWFFQGWSRDSAISSKAIGLIDSHFSKELLLNSVKNILPDGRIPNRFPDSKLGSADGVLWTFFRLYELYKNNSLTKKEKHFTYSKLSLSLQRLEKKYFSQGLFFNNKKETWMDTEFQNDYREGFCIEIQSMIAALYKFERDLAVEIHKKETHFYDIKLDNLKTNIRKNFFKNHYLRDEKNTKSIRPNIFIAYYVLPDLLSASEWESTFDRTLHVLKMNWGGLSSIARDSSLFAPYHTGQNNISYHRGDSWFFINHIAAISLNRFNPTKYNKFIESIIRSSVREMLTMGSVGDIAEISSATKLEPFGCLSQTWSLATFVELVDEMYAIHK